MAEGMGGCSLVYINFQMSLSNASSVGCLVADIVSATVGGEIELTLYVVVERSHRTAFAAQRKRQIKAVCTDIPWTAKSSLWNGRFDWVLAVWIPRRGAI